MLKRTLILITQEIMIIKMMMIRSQKIKITMAEIVIILIQLYA
jgi:hypothetical protein